MIKILRIIKKDENHNDINEIDEYIDNPEESIKILVKNGNKTSFQRTVNVTLRQ